jgi:ribosomal protein S18 acetylase RimI-like enzyme
MGVVFQEVFVSKFTVRKVANSFVTNGTLEQMARIYMEAFNGAPWNENWTLEMAKEELLACLRKKHDFFLSYEEGTDNLAGFAIGWRFGGSSSELEIQFMEFGVVPRAYYLSDLVTDQAFRRQGVATGIFEFLERTLQEDFVSQISLRTREDNLALLGILHSRSYQNYGSYAATTGGVESTRVVLSKTLRQS